MADQNFADRYMEERRPKRGQPKHTQPNPRDREIIDAHINGDKLEDIALKHGITRERVRQIAARWGAPARHDVRAEKHNKLVRSLVKAVQSLPGEPVQTIAKALGVSRTKASTLAYQNGIKLPIVGPATYKRKDEVEATIKLVTEQGLTIRKACGGDHNLEGYVARVMRDRGLKSNHARWGGRAAHDQREIEYVKLVQAGFAIKEIAKILNVSTMCAYKMGRHTNVKPRNWRRLALLPEQIMELVDRSRMAVDEAVKATKGKPMKKPIKGVPPLTGSVAEQCWTLREQGYTSSKIGDHLGITRNSVIGMWFRERKRRARADGLARVIDQVVEAMKEEK